MIYHIYLHAAALTSFPLYRRIFTSYPRSEWCLGNLTTGSLGSIKITTTYWSLGWAGVITVFVALSVEFPISRPWASYLGHLTLTVSRFFAFLSRYNHLSPMCKDDIYILSSLDSDCVAERIAPPFHLTTGPQCGFLVHRSATKYHNTIQAMCNYMWYIVRSPCPVWIHTSIQILRLTAIWTRSTLYNLGFHSLDKVKACKDIKKCSPWHRGLEVRLPISVAREECRGQAHTPVNTIGRLVD